MGKPVRTLFVTHAAEFGGAELSLLEILERLDRNRVNPVFASFSEGPLADAVIKLGIDVHIVSGAERFVRTRRADFVSYQKFYPVALGAASAVPGAIELAKYAKSQKVDVIYTNSSKAHILGGIAGRISRARVVWHFRDIFTEPRIKRFFSTASGMIADTVICNSHRTAIQFVSHKDARIIYNGLPVEEVRALRNAEDVKIDLGLSIDSLVVGMAGRLEKWKGVHVFLEAAKIVSEIIPNARFVIVGAPIYGGVEYIDELDGLTKTLGISNVIKFIGFKKDVYEYINSFDIYVHPSVAPEPFGRSIVEAMLLGKTVVSSGEGSPGEIVADGETGLLFPMGDFIRLAELTIELLKDSDRRNSYGKAGRERAIERFDSKRAVEEITRVLEENRV